MLKIKNIVVMSKGFKNKVPTARSYNKIEKKYKVKSRITNEIQRILVYGTKE